LEAVITTVLGDNGSEVVMLLTGVATVADVEIVDPPGEVAS
jgi:hypothetical protein